MSTIKGKVVYLGQKEQINERFSKLELWIETNDTMYAQTIKVEFHNDKIDALMDSGAKVGSIVEVSYNLRGRIFEKEDKRMVFNTIQAWKIQVVGSAAEDNSYESDNGVDDLPF